MQYYRRSKNVLVLAPSNRAVDNIAERVYKQLNNNDDGQCRLTGDIKSTPFAIQDAINSHKRYQRLEDVCDKGNKFWEHEKLGPREARKARDLHDSICTDIVSRANVIYSTFTASSVRKLKQRKFSPDVVIIDEAGQTSECLAWFGILQVIINSLLVYIHPEFYV
jgi:superfamily I DNA and/or RNA helicase